MSIEASELREVFTGPSVMARILDHQSRIVRFLRTFGEADSDGYATALGTFGLMRAGVPRTTSKLSAGGAIHRRTLVAS
jgi:hypothetical protein